MNASQIPGGTVFSTEPFLGAWRDNHAPNSRLLSLEVATDRGEGTVHGLVHERGDRTVAADFGPDGLFACPWPLASPGRGAKPLLQSMAAHRVSLLTWHVRFDHHWLAPLLEQSGASHQEQETHVLRLPESHDLAFAGYKKTRRTEIRACHARGVTIRPARHHDEIDAYCRLHEKLEAAKNFRVRYPAKLIHALLALPNVATLLIAEVNDQVIAGAFFIRDGDCLMYWHGAADRDFASYVPSGALVDRGIQLAIAEGMRTVNFGASTSDSLRGFKESFGAEPAQNRTFQLTARVSRVKRYYWALKGLVKGRGGQT
ncbi:MAG TPA: GNAT family N-acetyltransferase [Vicinamibacterales bacterium]|nr:GNAT family N-acetyltransferase [Vicinamibacterales bacterium]